MYKLVCTPLSTKK